jgi:hypothetical protein
LKQGVWCKRARKAEKFVISERFFSFFANHKAEKCAKNILQRITRRLLVMDGSDSLLEPLRLLEIAAEWFRVAYRMQKEPSENPHLYRQLPGDEEATERVGRDG